jgi:methylphosphotriester-DNA--protein-cysteine methyltransferase
MIETKEILAIQGGAKAVTEPAPASWLHGTNEIELGFSDPFTFSRAFKLIAGLAPRTWARANGAGRVSAA